MKGRIVCSTKGRDKGYFMVCVGEDGGLLLVCDGKERPLERPKRKSKKHLCFTDSHLAESEYKTNKSLRKSLAVYKSKIKEEP